MVRQKEREPCCICPCPCEGLVDVIGKKWVLCTLAQLGNEGTLRFNHLARKLPGLSSKTRMRVLSAYSLSSRMSRLISTLLAAPSVAARVAATDVVTSESALVAPYFATSSARRRT